MSNATGCLSLTRKIGETLLIGEATVIVKRIGPKRVQLVIKAPREMNVRRGELQPIASGVNELHED